MGDRIGDLGCIDCLRCEAVSSIEECDRRVVQLSDLRFVSVQSQWKKVEIEFCSC